MRNKEVWEINMREQFKRYGDNGDQIYNNPNPFYPDSRYYRKDKPAFALHDDGRIYIPDSDKK